MNRYGNSRKKEVIVGQIIRSRSMNWSDAVRAIAYFKDIKHVSRFGAYCRRNHLSLFPVHFIQSDICRPELLFEMEMDLAVLTHGEKGRET